MELLRLLARQRLLKVGEKGIMTIGTKEAVEREANNLALLLKKYKLDPSAFFLPDVVKIFLIVPSLKPCL